MDGSSYLMWYSGQRGSTVRIGLATSSDGLLWSKYYGNPVIDVGPSGTWDAAYVFASTIVERSNKLLMWYWGGSDPAGRTEQIAPILSVYPNSLSFDPHTGQKSFSISNVGGGILTWILSGNQSWLVISPSSGSGNANISVGVDRSDLNSGTYNATIFINSTGGTKTISVSVQVIK